MEWLRWLGELSPSALLIVALWVIATKYINPMLSSHRKTIERITRTQEEMANTIRDELRANTEAVAKAMEHNETIINNHLSHQETIYRSLLSEMRDVAGVIGSMNNRSRKYDNDPKRDE